jgi:adhesin transport system outer membrane protein
LQQFVVGQRTLLDVLDVENELYQYNGQLVTARTNERIAAYKMLALSGDLLRSLDIDEKIYTSSLMH